MVLVSAHSGSLSSLKALRVRAADLFVSYRYVSIYTYTHFELNVRPDSSPRPLSRGLFHKNTFRERERTAKKGAGSSPSGMPAVASASSQSRGHADRRTSFRAVLAALRLPKPLSSPQRESESGTDQLEIPRESRFRRQVWSSLLSPLRLAPFILSSFFSKALAAYVLCIASCIDNKQHEERL